MNDLFFSLSYKKDTALSRIIYIQGIRYKNTRNNSKSNVERISNRNISIYIELITR